jgi:DNA-directed RNA polymerase specialized sigma24 family protein
MPISDSSCQRWISRLEAGEDAAAERLWNVYFEQLVQLARGRLNAKYQRAQDAEDVALSAFNSFCRGVEQKKFPLLADTQGLWRLLVSITIHKVLHVVRDQDRIKRGGKFRELAGFDNSTDSINALNQIVSREPSPDFAAEVAEQYDAMLGTLQDPDLVEIATMKLEGYTNAEIAERRNRSERTIERKLHLIRKLWLHIHVEHDRGDDSMDNI